jgi:coenzyme PQQ precursor peptide PqqA
MGVGDARLRPIRPVPMSRSPATKTGTTNTEDMTMAWTKPRILEISLGCEINAYACAEVARKG